MFNMYQPYQNLIRVNGIEGAKAYQMSPNSTVALFDGNDDLMYIKMTDGAGFPTIRTFRFTEVKDAPRNDYMTRKEVEDYVKHIVQSTTDNAQNGADSNAQGHTE